MLSDMSREVDEVDKRVWGGGGGVERMVFACVTASQPSGGKHPFFFFIVNTFYTHGLHT
jgi:hypothetical protein